MAKIIIDHEEEIELNEREQKIYDAGHTEGIYDCVIYISIGTIIIELISLILK